MNRETSRPSDVLDRIRATCRAVAERAEHVRICWDEIAAYAAALGADAPDRALVCARRALALKPAWPEAIALQGCARYANNDYYGAIKIFKKITTDKKNEAFAWLMIGRCYQRLGQSEPAQKAYEKAANLNPEGKLITLLAKPQK